ncbi:hypothetical protein P9112_000363 [Eukaryota sp. TZLM1-RC]
MASSDVVEQFTLFFRSFFINDVIYYHELLAEIHLDADPVLPLDAHHLQSHDSFLYKNLVNSPETYFPLLNKAATSVAREILVNDNVTNMDPSTLFITVRPFNLLPTESRNLKDLSPSDIDSLITLTGMVTRVSAVIPDPVRAFFQCTVCYHSTTVALTTSSRFEPPSLCTQCQKRNTFRVVHNASTYVDKQVIKLQESPDHVEDGSIPTTITCIFYKNLVDSVRPGDRIDLTGVYKARGIKPSSKKRSTRVVFTTYLEGVSVRKLDKRLGEDTSSLYSTIDPSENETAITFNEEEINRFKTIASRDDVIDYLVSCIAPSIYGNNDVKEGLLCQLVGGTSKDVSTTNSSRLRGEVNILLVGDPGTAKSQLLDFCHRLSPRGLFTSGKGSSAVGLTAYVTRDPDTGETVLESGALVLSDLGICCIDEFDKMNEGSRTILHEALEQQTISVAKSGIVCTLNARTSVLAAANPIESKYNHNLSVVENINIPPTLLSRFDLIYLILDVPNRELDTLLAQHVVSLYCGTKVERSIPGDDVLPIGVLSKYIAYVRSTMSPKLTDESAALLTEHYLDMRVAGNNNRTVTATPRQLESLIRISEAYAKIRMSDTVDPKDVSRALELVQNALKQSATNPKTGLIDLDKILTGKSAQDREFDRDLEDKIKELLNERDSWRFQELFRSINERFEVGANHSQVETVLRNMEGHLVSWNEGVIRKVG